MQTGVLTREFSFNGLKLADPDPKLSPEQVRSIMATLYPDIATGGDTDEGAEQQHQQTQQKGRG